MECARAIQDTGGDHSRWSPPVSQSVRAGRVEWGWRRRIMARARGHELTTWASGRRAFDIEVGKGSKPCNSKSASVEGS